MTTSEYYKLTCQCLILERHPEFKKGISEKFISGVIELDKFVLLCSNHLILPAITLIFQKHGLINLFPNEYSEHLLGILELNRKRNREILDQIDEINAALKKRDIQPIYLKGTANLMENVYSDNGERMIGDIDLLVQDKNYLKTINLIMALGYKSDKLIFDDITSFKHYPRLYRTDVPADIEIHRVPVTIKNSKQFTTDLNFQYKIAIPNKKNCYVQSDEHKVIHNFIHSQLCHLGYQYKITSLRDLYDFHILSQRVDFKKVLPLIEQKEKAETFYNFVNRMFSTNSQESFSANKNANKYYKQFIWFLNHPKQHRLYITIVKVLDVFIQRPFLKIKNAIFQKSARKSLFRRLKDPEWYKIIYNGIKSIFSS